MKTTPKTSLFFTSLIVVMSLILSACGPSATPAPTTDVNPIFTQAAATIMVGLTQTSAAMPTETPLPPTSTPEPSPTTMPTPEILMTATQPVQVFPTSIIPTANPATAFGCYNATLLADVTILYAPAFKPGDKFTKTWRVKNTGSCDWTRGFQIAFTSGDRFGTDTTTINQKVPAGGVTEISLAMTAPSLTGVVTSNWQLVADIAGGKSFGPVLSVAITLPGSPSGTGTSGGCLNSSLVSDVTVPSGTTFDTNKAFTKTWLIKNTGTCTWDGSFKITFVGGDLLGSDTTKIRKTVGPGSSAEISLEMTAPGTTGTVTSSWQMASDDGTLFGQLFVITIVVK